MITLDSQHIDSDWTLLRLAMNLGNVVLRWSQQALLLLEQSFKWDSEFDSCMTWNLVNIDRFVNSTIVVQRLETTSWKIRRGPLYDALVISVNPFSSTVFLLHRGESRFPSLSEWGKMNNVDHRQLYVVVIAAERRTLDIWQVYTCSLWTTKMKHRWDWTMSVLLLALIIIISGINIIITMNVLGIIIFGALFYDSYSICRGL